MVERKGERGSGLNNISEIIVVTELKSLSTLCKLIILAKH